MGTKKCLRSGQCCSGMLAIVPKTEESNLNPDFLSQMSVDKALQYVEEHSEMMDTTCKWLVRDEITSEATCKVHTHKSDHCVSYPEHIGGSEWCGVGLNYWKMRKLEGLVIPEWVNQIIGDLEQGGVSK